MCKTYVKNIKKLIFKMSHEKCTFCTKPVKSRVSRPLRIRTYLIL